MLLSITIIRLGLGLGLRLGLGKGWVRVSVGLWVRVGLGLGLTVDIHIWTIMSINEDHTPILIGRQVDRSTSRQVDTSVLAVQINDIIEVQPISTGNFKAYHMLMLPDKAISEDSFVSLVVWWLAPPPSPPGVVCNHASGI